MKSTILIIEDNEDIREGTAEILELAGYNTLTAANGKIGIDKAQKEKPDLIICDIMMPELDGYGVLYLLNKNIETAAIPLIFLTAKVARNDMRKGMEMGADDYLTKPFDDLELLNAVESRLNKKKKQEEFYTNGLKSLNQFAASGENSKELETLIAEKKIRNIKKGQTIYYDGDNSQGIFLVLSGTVKAVKLNEEGREFLTGIYNADEYFGVHDAIISQTHTESAQAMEDCSICILPKEQLNDLLSKNSGIAMRFIRLLSQSIYQKEEQLIQLAYNSVRKRMAVTLLKINEIHQNQNVFKISRDDLAAMAGMATETVSRTLSDFKDEKLIEKKGSEVTIIDSSKLKNMKN